VKGFFSIRAKFLSVMSGLLIACLVVYLLIAVQVFKTDKTELIFDLNRSMVSNLSAEIETELNGVSDKLRLFALLSFNDNNKLKPSTIFGNQSEIIYASLYKQNEKTSIHTYTDQNYFETYGLTSNFFSETIVKNRPIPFSEILKNGEYFWNASTEGGTPLLGYGRNVIVEDASGIPTEHLAVVGYVKLDKILKILNLVHLSEVSIVDQSGNLLIHKNFEWLKNSKNISQSPLFKAAAESKVHLSVASLKDDQGEFLGAFGKSYQSQIYVLARASKEQAFSAVYELVSRSLSFALIVITISLLFAFLISKSLTQPISILVEGMQKVSSGDLTTQIEVKTRDETQMLASSFNQMISELKQSRDELQEINRELDKKVKERTLQLEIQNKAVKEAQEALLKTTRLASAGEIAGRAAHEVLNPLTGILTRLSSTEKKVQTQTMPQINMMKDIFASWKADHAQGGFETLTKNWQQNSGVDAHMTLWQEDMQNIELVQNGFENLFRLVESDTKFLIQESQRINKIISGMRKLSRLHSEIDSYSGHQLLIDCRNIMADLFNREDIDIIEIFNAQDDYVLLDRDEFIQAITNLFRNSLQAFNKELQKEKAFVKIATSNDAQNFYIEISDNGSGVALENQPLLFEKQFTTKSADEGTGLGLGISRRFIRAHGGNIEFISSNEFFETKFKITIPLQAAASKQPKSEAA
jgi:signal transduction histidine kinase